MSYLTWREYVRSGPVCLGALVLIAGGVVVLLGNSGHQVLGEYTFLGGAVIAIIGLLLIIAGFFFTTKKRDSVLAPVRTDVEDVPPPPPPPD